MKKAFVVALFVCACGSRTEAECDAMLDRYLDMTEDDDPALARIPADVRGEPRGGVRASRISERRASMAYLNAEKRCMSEVTAKEHACAMKAPSPNEWEACFEYR